MSNPEDQLSKITSKHSRFARVIHELSKEWAALMHEVREAWREITDP